jgi:hypothetical protein
VATFKGNGIKDEYAIANTYDVLQLNKGVIKLTAELGNVYVLLYNVAAMKDKNIIDEKT